MKKKITFPINYDDLEKFLNSEKSNYIVNSKIGKTKEIIDKNQDIQLFCTLHKIAFTSKLRYFLTNTKDNTGQCKSCMVEQGKSRNITKKKLIVLMRSHPIHPVELIDKRFELNEIIPKKIPLRVKCLYCGYDEQKVSYNNFFSEDKYEHKTFHCLGCAKLEKLNCDLKDKEIFTFLRN